MVDGIVFHQVAYAYNKGTPLEASALHDVDLTIPLGKITAIIGHTGSGKSTLLRHLNVLIQPSDGYLEILGRRIDKDSKHQDLKLLRKQVGVVFQFPEAQLFEETVVRDVMFGPLNFGLSQEEAYEIAVRQLELVGIGEEYYQRSPFELSGGQMRRVAIAGVLALEPEILVLDEPTAGLDPVGHQEMMTLFYKLHQEEGKTLILVTHQMEDVAKYADYVVVMDSGTNLLTGTPQEVFIQEDWLEDRQLQLPKPMAFYLQVRRDLFDSGYGIFTQAEWNSLPRDEHELAQRLIAMRAANDQEGGGLNYE